MMVAVQLETQFYCVLEYDKRKGGERELECMF